MCYLAICRYTDGAKHNIECEHFASPSFMDVYACTTPGDPSGDPGDPAFSTFSTILYHYYKSMIKLLYESPGSPRGPYSFTALPVLTIGTYEVIQQFEADIIDYARNQNALDTRLAKCTNIRPGGQGSRASWALYLYCCAI